ncbi:exopolyphosphatase [Corynebacterium sp. 3HC-13]|uniref:Ppx/GppA phosphatase family protein n=1 Tax=Corynebacterium poyangense TaxID=2684405 RepID=UPI001CCFAAF2|nr:Ppx/GppA phosphatase family protein [Corynebacterium poyangense]MBZ8176227.1 exopolyphosphatase [Corynebacterium poyangense]
MTKLAAIDCGTNSIRLLISDISSGSPQELHREMRIVRLGQGVDATGDIDPQALERTRLALAEYLELMKQENVSAVRMVATSAMRDASNRNEFFAMTAELLGQITPGAQAEIISGEEEAQLSFQGAVADLPPEDGPFCVIDLGGGSTEFVVGEHDGDLKAAHSIQVGCVRVTERIMRTDPPTDMEQEIAREYVDERLQRVELLVPLDQARTFVGCAGTFTTLSALAQGLESYDPALIHCSSLQFDALKVLVRDLIAENAAQRRKHPVVHPGRADVLGAGALIVSRIVAMSQRLSSVDHFVVSEKDILDGIIQGLMSKT